MDTAALAFSAATAMKLLFCSASEVTGALAAAAAAAAAAEF